MEHIAPLLLIGLIGIAIFQIVSGSPPFAIIANIVGVLLAAALFVAYLRRWRWRVGRFFDGVRAGSPPAELARVAPRHPVFRVGPRGLSG